jgi:hypothetical protein
MLEPVYETKDKDKKKSALFDGGSEEDEEEFKVKMQKLIDEQVPIQKFFTGNFMINLI